MSWSSEQHLCRSSFRMHSLHRWRQSPSTWSRAHKALRIDTKSILKFLMTVMSCDSEVFWLNCSVPFGLYMDAEKMYALDSVWLPWSHGWDHIWQSGAVRDSLRLLQASCAQVRATFPWARSWKLGAQIWWPWGDTLQLDNAWYEKFPGLRQIAKGHKCRGLNG